MADTLQNRVERRLKELGKSARRASLEAGLSQDFVRGLLRNAQASPRGSNLIALAKVLETSEKWLLHGDEAQVETPKITRQTVSAPNALASARPRLPSGGPIDIDARAERADTIADIPVFAAARGGSRADSMILSNEPIEYVARPEPLRNVSEAYAVYIVGDSMSPAYEQGDMVLVHPHRPPRPGNDVIVIGGDEDGTRYAVIKRLVKSGLDNWTLRQFNPPPGELDEFELNKFDWKFAHPIVAKYSSN